MKYDLKAFNSAVKYYETALSAYKGKTIFIAFDASNDTAFFSMAPLSRAAHNLGCFVSANLFDKASPPIDAMMDVWVTYANMVAGLKNEKTKALHDFIQLVDKKSNGEFKHIFKAPELLIDANKKGFMTSDGEFMEYHPEWFRKYRWNDLIATGKIVWNQVYDLKKSEKVGLGFDLILKADDMKNPLEDYFDSYAIARSTYHSCYARRKTMKAVSSVKKMDELGERTSELSTTLLGCELSKNINEPVFRAFRKLSNLLKLHRFGTNDATFFIKGEGYGGRHIFGQVIGYPTPNRKSRWDGPGGIIYQLPWYPQTKFDSRKPLCRMGFTDTVPVDKYIEACKIDWLAMKRKDDKLIALAKKSEKIIVASSKTNLEIGLVKKDGERRELMNSDVDIRTKIDKAYQKKGIIAGNMANIPGGEMFTTPEYVKGTVYGDVVINIDKSYPLMNLSPLVIKCYGNKYKVISGPKHVVAKMNEKKKEALAILLKQEKNKSLPQSVIDTKKRNYENIGEFAINTNPKASLCNYLIINEKIAGMIHVAFGSGFEADRSSVYHYDTVINAKKQKLDIYGVGKDGKKHWMMRQGILQVK